MKSDKAKTIVIVVLLAVAIIMAVMVANLVISAKKDSDIIAGNEDVSSYYDKDNTKPEGEDESKPITFGGGNILLESGATSYTYKDIQGVTHSVVDGVEDGGYILESDYLSMLRDYKKGYPYTRVVEGTCDNPLDIPDVEGYDKDIYGNYIITEEMVKNRDKVQADLGSVDTGRKVLDIPYNLYSIGTVGTCPLPDHLSNSGLYFVYD